MAHGPRNGAHAHRKDSQLFAMMLFFVLAMMPFWVLAMMPCMRSGPCPFPCVATAR
jgi:hypothetical protein